MSGCGCSHLPVRCVVSSLLPPLCIATLARLFSLGLFLFFKRSSVLGLFGCVSRHQERWDWWRWLSAGTSWSHSHSDLLSGVVGLKALAQGALSCGSELPVHFPHCDQSCWSGNRCKRNQQPDCSTHWANTSKCHLFSFLLSKWCSYRVQNESFYNVSLTSLIFSFCHRPCFGPWNISLLDEPFVSNPIKTSVGLHRWTSKRLLRKTSQKLLSWLSLGSLFSVEDVEFRSFGYVCAQ